MIEKSKKFCHRYNAVLKPSNTRYYRRSSVPFNYGNYNTPTATQINYDTEPGVEITMSTSDFAYLLELHEKLEEIMYSTPDRLRGRGIENMLHNYQRELRLRSHYPQLQELYNQYQMMLHLLDDGKN